MHNMSSTEQNIMMVNKIERPLAESAGQSDRGCFTSMICFSRLDMELPGTLFAI